MGIREFLFGTEEENVKRSEYLEKKDNICKAKEIFNSLHETLFSALSVYKDHLSNKPYPLKSPSKFENDEEYKEYCTAKIRYDRQMKSAEDLRRESESIIKNLFEMVPIQDIWFKICVGDSIFGLSRKTLSRNNPYLYDARNGIIVVPWENISNVSINDFLYYRDMGSSYEFYHLDGRHMESLTRRIFKC
jgi:hypothetical protein